MTGTCSEADAKRRGARTWRWEHGPFGWRPFACDACEAEVRIVVCGCGAHVWACVCAGGCAECRVAVRRSRAA